MQAVLLMTDSVRLETLHRVAWLRQERGLNGLPFTRSVYNQVSTGLPLCPLLPPVHAPHLLANP